MYRLDVKRRLYAFLNMENLHNYDESGIFARITQEFNATTDRYAKILRKRDDWIKRRLEWEKTHQYPQWIEERLKQFGPTPTTPRRRPKTKRRRKKFWDSLAWIVQYVQVTLSFLIRLNDLFRATSPLFSELHPPLPCAMHTYDARYRNYDNLGNVMQWTQCKHIWPYGYEASWLFYVSWTSNGNIQHLLLNFR